jgi:hypothetical protein
VAEWPHRQPGVVVYESGSEHSRDVCSIVTLVRRTRLYRKQLVDGVYCLDKVAVSDEFFYLLAQMGAMVLLSELQGTAIQREMVPFLPHLLLYGLKTLCGIEGMHAPLALLSSDEALMQPVGFNRHLRECLLAVLDLTH